MMSATRVMNEMEENNILPDHVTFHTMFSGLINPSGINGVLPLYHQMIGKNFVQDNTNGSIVNVTFLQKKPMKLMRLGFLEILEKGRYLSKTGFRALERCLIEMGDEVKLKKRQIAVPVSRGHAMVFDALVVAPESKVLKVASISCNCISLMNIVENKKYTAGSLQVGDRQSLYEHEGIGTDATGKVSAQTGPKPSKWYIG
ncbi:pentatricopeptide repeat-containing protein [Tanacetum coccineum]